jgi:hypothetical protein
MFCSQCGIETLPKARFCMNCGSSVSAEPPVSKPDVDTQTVETPEKYSVVWNPNTTANWSIIFTPALGAYLQMLNWRSLGEHEKAAGAKFWFFLSLAMLIVYVLMSIFMDDIKDASLGIKALATLFLICWYFLAGRAQSKYVKEKFGTSYAKKPWGTVLACSIAIAAIYSIVLVVFVSKNEHITQVQVEAQDLVGVQAKVEMQPVSGIMTIEDFAESKSKLPEEVITEYTTKLLPGFGKKLGWSKQQIAEETKLIQQAYGKAKK